MSLQTTAPFWHMLMIADASQINTKSREPSRSCSFEIGFAFSMSRSSLGAPLRSLTFQEFEDSDVSLSGSENIMSQVNSMSWIEVYQKAFAILLEDRSTLRSQIPFENLHEKIWKMFSDV